MSFNTLPLHYFPFCDINIPCTEFQSHIPAFPILRGSFYSERVTNFIFILKLEQGKNSKALREKLNETLLPYKNFVHTITTDNGPEFADHLAMKSGLDSCIYFANPYCSWEKGSIEHANKLIRQYIPKEDNLNSYTQAQLNEIQYAINNRPREKLNFDTPKNLFFNFVNGNVAFDG